MRIDKILCLQLHTLVICKDDIGISIREMLTSVLRTLVKDPVKESFYGKRKKKINVLSVFFISHKSDVKNFFNKILNQCPKDTR